MSETYTTYSGWYVRHPWYQSAPPTKPTDLVNAYDMQVTHRPHHFHETEAEAWAEVREHATAMAEQAEKDLAFYSIDGVHISPKGVKTFVPIEKVEEWRAEAKQKLEIAEATLALCDERERAA
ncbi:hypothetical protein [Alienimonas sp. DA493]|uniref:hypothetical protein n=1 Tax=Alienimonas sp. DA493 TaxID=3373605 RepID=UPI003754EA37